MGSYSPPKLGRNPFHSGKFSERAIGDLGRKFTELLQSTKILRPPTSMVLLVIDKKI